MPSLVETTLHFRDMKAAVELAAREGRPTDLHWRMAISAFLLQEAVMLHTLVGEQLPNGKDRP